MGKMNGSGWTDRRFAGGNRYHLSRPISSYMRVPDEVRKTVVFIGVRDDLGEWDWKATGYLIALSDVRLLWHETDELNRQWAISHPFRLLATAAHVAENLEGKDFALRTMTNDGEVRIIEGHADQRWWYHPTEREYVDAAVTIFYPPDVRELDLFDVPLELFADEEKIKETHIGVGDEVFIAGLFSKVKGTMRQNAIVRIGNLAMMPGERIPFKDGKLIEAYLIESRSIGGLSGCPVFVRETIQVDAGIRFKPGKNLLSIATAPGESAEHVKMDGLGRIFFLGSMIGHWDTPSAFTPTMSEAVNMGIAPVVPAHKILQIIKQPELIGMAEKISAKMNKKREEGKAVLDFDKKKEPFTEEDFDNALNKVTRKIEKDK